MVVDKNIMKVNLSKNIAEALKCGVSYDDLCAIITNEINNFKRGEKYEQSRKNQKSSKKWYL